MLACWMSDQTEAGASSPLDSPASPARVRSPSPNERRYASSCAGRHPQRGADGAEVGRLGEDAGRRQVERPVGPVVVDGVAVEGQRRRHADVRGRGDQPGIEQGAERQHLLDAARLVDVLDRPAAAVGARRRGRVVGVDGRVVGQRQHLTGVDVDRDRHTGLATGLLDRLGQPALRVPLQVAVEGELQAQPGIGLLLAGRAQRDLLAVRGDHVRGLAVVARHQEVEDPLETLQPGRRPARRSRPRWRRRRRPGRPAAGRARCRPRPARPWTARPAPGPPSTAAPAGPGRRSGCRGRAAPRRS